MGGHEAIERGREMAIRVRCHVALGAAGIGDDGARREDRREGLHNRPHLTHRHREQHEIRIAHADRHIVGNLIHDTKSQRVVEVGAPAANAHYAPDNPRSPERSREGTADQADADYRQTFDAHAVGRQRERACPSADRKRAFSPGSPIETRRKSGMP